MEAQLYTRNALTGAMMILAFVLVWLPSPCGQNLSSVIDWIDNHDSSVAPGLLAIVVSTPFLGFIIGTIVQFFINFFPWHLYKNGVYKDFKIRILEQTTDSRLKEVKNEFEKTEPCNIWDFFFFQFAKTSIVEWARRRCTIYLMGFNWTCSVFLGIVFAFLFDPHIYLAKLLSLIILIALSIIFILNSLRSRKEVKQVECLWYKTFLDQNFLKLFQGKVEEIIPGE